jgi:hypothetical protein
LLAIVSLGVGWKVRERVQAIAIGIAAAAANAAALVVLWKSYWL